MALRKEHDQLHLKLFSDSQQKTLGALGAPAQTAHCIVCMDEITRGKLQLHCGHAFHEGCIRHWFAAQVGLESLGGAHPGVREQTACPICREQASGEDWMVLSRIEPLDAAASVQTENGSPKSEYLQRLHKRLQPGVASLAAGLKKAPEPSAAAREQEIQKAVAAIGASAAGVAAREAAPAPAGVAASSGIGTDAGSSSLDRVLLTRLAKRAASAKRGGAKGSAKLKAVGLESIWGRAILHADAQYLVAEQLLPVCRAALESKIQSTSVAKGPAATLSLELQKDPFGDELAEAPDGVETEVGPPPPPRPMLLAQIVCRETAQMMKLLQALLAASDKSQFQCEEVANRFRTPGPTHFRYVSALLTLTEGELSTVVQVDVHHTAMLELNQRSGAEAHVDFFRTQLVSP